jgi:hypothetical protein
VIINLDIHDYAWLFMIMCVSLCHRVPLLDTACFLIYHHIIFLHCHPFTHSCMYHHLAVIKATPCYMTLAEVWYITFISCPTYHSNSDYVFRASPCYDSYIGTETFFNLCVGNIILCPHDTHMPGQMQMCTRNIKNIQ